jgi:hypothetical protein
VDDALRQHLAAFRIQLRACRNVARTTLQMANDLERRIDEHLAAEPKEAERNGHNPHRATVRR